MGENQAIKMFIAPKLNYLLSMLPLNVPVTTSQTIDKMFTQFIWAGKRARMKLTRLQATVECGGLRLPNVRPYQEAFLGAQIVSLLQVQMIDLCRGDPEYSTIRRFDLRSLIRLPIS